MSLKNTVVFIAHGFFRDNIRLQPWRYIYELAVKFNQTHQVVVLTDIDSGMCEEQWAEGFTVIQTVDLSVRRQKQLHELILRFNPVQLWWSITPRSIVYWRLFRKLNIQKYAFITCPIYSYWQLVRASAAGIPFEQLSSVWKQRFIPRFLFSIMLNDRKVFKKIFTQSESNKDILIASGVLVDKLDVLRVGVDAKDLAPVSKKVLEEQQATLQFNKDSVTLLYFGAIRKIRGFYALIDAFSMVVNEIEDINLVVLSRDTDIEHVAETHKLLRDAGLTDRVQIISGWLEREQVWAHIELCDMAVLPFVIVPSDVPIAILEAMARGKPVIGSSVDGIPELITNRGLVVDPLDTKSIAGAIISLATDDAYRSKLGTNARTYMQTYPDWKQIGNEAVMKTKLL